MYTSDFLANTNLYLAILHLVMQPFFCLKNEIRPYLFLLEIASL